MKSRFTILSLAGLIAVLHLVVGRGGSAAHGLRLSEEHALLKTLAKASESYSVGLLHAALVGVAGAGALATFRGRRESRLLVLLGLLAAATGVTAIAETRGLCPREITRCFAGAALALALVAARTWISLLALPLLGALAGLVWCVLAQRGSEPPLILEPLAEVLALGGIAVVGLVAIGLPGSRSHASGGGHRPRIVWLIVGLTLFAACWRWPAASRHVIGHLINCDRAGLPFPVIAPLVALALAGIAACATQAPSRQALALALLFTFLGARGPAADDAAFRAAAALFAVIYEPSRRQPEPAPGGSVVPAPGS